MSNNTQTILIITNLIVTSIVAVVTAMRCKAKCGDNMCTCKPKLSAYSPGSDTGEEKQPILPNGAVAVVIGDTSPSNNKS